MSSIKTKLQENAAFYKICAIFFAMRVVAIAPSIYGGSKGAALVHNNAIIAWLIVLAIDSPIMFCTEQLNRAGLAKNVKRSMWGIICTFSIFSILLNVAYILIQGKSVALAASSPLQKFGFITSNVATVQLIIALVVGSIPPVVVVLSSILQGWILAGLEAKKNRKSSTPKTPQEKAENKLLKLVEEGKIGPEALKAFYERDKPLAPVPQDTTVPNGTNTTVPNGTDGTKKGDDSPAAKWERMTEPKREVIRATVKAMKEIEQETGKAASVTQIQERTKTTRGTAQRNKAIALWLIEQEAKA